ncbi:MAG: hypothetical protein R3F34_16155 [Planctomycetota bacterium]
MSKADAKKKSGRAAVPATPAAILEWRIVVRRLAAGVGALCGLVSLLYHAPAWVACVRAGGASFLIAALGRLGERAVGSSLLARKVEERTDRTPEDQEEGSAAIATEAHS